MGLLLGPVMTYDKYQSYNDKVAHLGKLYDQDPQLQTHLVKNPDSNVSYVNGDPSNIEINNTLGYFLGDEGSNYIIQGRSMYWLSGIITNTTDISAQTYSKWNTYKIENFVFSQDFKHVLSHQVIPTPLKIKGIILGFDMASDHYFVLQYLANSTFNDLYNYNQVNLIEFTSQSIISNRTILVQDIDNFDFLGIGREKFDVYNNSIYIREEFYHHSGTFMAFYYRIAQYDLESLQLISYMNVSSPVRDFSIDNGNITIWYRGIENSAYSNLLQGNPYMIYNLGDFFSGNAVPLQTIYNAGPRLTYTSQPQIFDGNTYRDSFGCKLVDNYLVFPYIIWMRYTAVFEGISTSRLVAVTVRDEYTNSDIQGNVIGYVLLLSAVIMAVYIKSPGRDQRPPNDYYNVNN